MPSTHVRQVFEQSKRVKRTEESLGMGGISGVWYTFAAVCGGVGVAPIRTLIFKQARIRILMQEVPVLASSTRPSCNAAPNALVVAHRTFMVRCVTVHAERACHDAGRNAVQEVVNPRLSRTHQTVRHIQA